MAKKSRATDDPLFRVIDAVNNSPKYGRVSDDVIRKIAERELAKGLKLRQVVKAVKSKLHQVGGAYLENMAYDQWLEALKRTGSPPDPNKLKRAAQLIVRHHASTRERLPILDEFYAQTLGSIAPVTSVIDAACGLNPLTIPWMPLSEDATYYAYDIYEDMIAFLGGFLALAGIQGHAEARDLSQYVPPQCVQLAMVLKTLPCLEQIDKFVGLRLLEGLNADYLLVSFPVRSLGGLDKNMRANYEAHFRDLLAGKSWSYERFEFATELAFLVDKRGQA